MLKGKKFLDRGDYAAAAEQFKTATGLLITNASAWNYYGVALQGAGQPDEAATAYQAALKYDRDLVEAHFNLGILSLEQNKADMARTEFTAYTLHRPNEAAGWLKLGSAQLKLGDTAAAERSYSTVYHMDATSPEALNGLGLARAQSGKPQDAAKFFSAAVKAHPDYAPALLNLATVSQQYLHDNRAALENYHAYLALKTRPANWTEVNALASSLEAEGRPETRLAAVAAPPAERPAPQVPSTALETKPQTKIPNVVTQRSTTATKPPSMAKPANPPAIKPIPVQVVEVKPEEPIVTKPRTGSAPVAMAQPAPVDAQTPVAEEATDDQPKKTLWGKLFGGSNKNGTADNSKYRGEGLTPLPGGTDTESLAATKPPVVIPAAKPLETVTPVPIFARYNYFSPRKPAAGDRTAANGAFTKARVFELDEKWPDALQWYQQAATLDPSWFEAQYNAGVLAHRLRNYSVALPRYELALVVQPDSADARYNFALALKAAGYIPDAAEQLKIILAAAPKEVRAHLALANICAQSLRDTAQAREHYQSVLELDPGNPQTSDIRFWLSANPK